MPKLDIPTLHQIESAPRCCLRCFADRGLKSFIRRYGTLGEECDFCEGTDVRTVGVEAIAARLAPLFHGYARAEAGTHYIPEIEEADGEPLDRLLDEDNPELFASGLTSNRRQKLVQAFLDVFDSDSISDGFGGRDVNDFWVRPGSEIWAGAEDDRSFLTPPERWQTFVWEVSHESRYFRLDPEVDPQVYLTPTVLKSLVRRLDLDTPLYRAVLGGVLRNEGLTALPPERMAGPDREHSKEGLRVNPAGVPVLYAAKDVATSIAEVRPWVGAPVSVATLRLEREVRVVDFSPRRRRQKLAGTQATNSAVANGVSQKELDDILTTIGAAMARPIDPADSQVSYVPTQYVAEVVRRAGFDGVMFKSAVGPGVNVVLFNKTNARVEVVGLHRVTGLMYSATPVAPPPPDFKLDF